MTTKHMQHGQNLRSSSQIRNLNTSLGHAHAGSPSLLSSARQGKGKNWGVFLVIIAIAFLILVVLFKNLYQDYTGTGRAGEQVVPPAPAATQCSDALDNDWDAAVDMLDPDCTALEDQDES
ncbi:hypothetical protein HYS48_02605 [Candidatus Woesearchaeota archaeon]|nr:hypothetical protein [Candidatus Woesearchaeota archaeon]